MPEKVTQIGNFDLTKIEKATEHVFQSVYEQFFSFLEHTEEMHSLRFVQSKQSPLEIFWHRRSKFFGDVIGPCQAIHSILHQRTDDYDPAIVSLDMNRRRFDHTSHQEFTYSSKIGTDDHPDAHILSFEVRMELVNRENDTDISKFNLAGASAIVQIYASIDQSHRFGALCSYQRTSVYRLPQIFTIFPGDAGSILALHMMFLKSQFAYRIYRTFPDSLPKIDQWHRQWFCDTILKTRFNGYSDNYSADYRANVVKDDQSFYHNFAGELIKIFTNTDELDIFDGMHTASLKRIGCDFNVIYPELHNSCDPNMLANAASITNGGVFPDVKITDCVEHDGTFEITLSEDKLFASKFECCAPDRDDAPPPVEYRRMTINAKNVRENKETLYNEIQRIGEAYIGIIYAQYEDGFGKDVAFDHLNAQMDIFHKVIDFLKSPAMNE